MNCFKAYDIRGRIPDELNPDIAYRIGRAYTQHLRPQIVAVGRDIRLSSFELCEALIKGLTDGGADVRNIGLCGTEDVYFTTFNYQLDGGIMITASHNPMDYNGMKLVRSESRPISGDSGLREIERLVSAGHFAAPQKRGKVCTFEHRNDFVEHLLSYIDLANLKSLKFVVNAGNGCAGPFLDSLEAFLPFELVKINHQPDGTFPNGIPNPLLPENRSTTSEAVRQHNADMGIAWDGDFDRCFLFDENGGFIEGYYVVGLLADAFLNKYPKSKIIHDPRLYWNTVEIVERAGGVPVMSKTGHAFIKERMRSEDAIYGGEMSAHHYFRDFAYCDSGMIPWLLVAELLSTTGKPLSQLIEDRKRAYPASGEINRLVEKPQVVMGRVETAYGHGSIDQTDGLSIAFDDWRFNLRCSNTEPVLRLNVESRGDIDLMQEKTQALLATIE